MFIPNFIPNPLNKESKLSEFEKKKKLLKEGLDYIQLIKNIIFWAIFGFACIFFLKVSVHIVLILVGTEVLMNLIMGYVKLKELRSVYSIETISSGKSYRTLLIKDEYWELIKSVFKLIGSVVAVILIYTLFHSEISNFVIQGSSFFNPAILKLLKYIIFVFVIKAIVEIVIKFIRFCAVKRIKESNDFAQIDQEYTLIKKKFELIQTVMLEVFLLVVFAFGVGFFNIITLFLLFGLLKTAIFGVLEIKGIKKVKLSEEIIDKTVVRHKIEYFQDEEIIESVFGITHTAPSFKGMFKIVGVSSFGSGKYFFPENTLLITNKRLLMIQIPLTGGNKIIGKRDYVMENFFFNRQEMRQKGEQILKTKSMSEIIELAMDDVFFEDIKSLTLLHTEIIIEKINNEKLGYTFLDSEYIEPLKKVLRACLGDRFLVKESR